MYPKFCGSSVSSRERSIIRDFGLTAQKSLGDNLREVEKSLPEMIDKNVLLDYAVTYKIVDPKSNKLIDVMLDL